MWSFRTAEVRSRTRVETSCKHYDYLGSDLWRLLDNVRWEFVRNSSSVRAFPNIKRSGELYRRKQLLRPTNEIVFTQQKWPLMKELMTVDWNAYKSSCVTPRWVRQWCSRITFENGQTKNYSKRWFWRGIECGLPGIGFYKQVITTVIQHNHNKEFNVVSSSQTMRRIVRKFIVSC